jgi:hypothetical protein
MKILCPMPAIHSPDRARPIAYVIAVGIEDHDRRPGSFMFIRLRPGRAGRQPCIALRIDCDAETNGTLKFAGILGQFGSTSKPGSDSSDRAGFAAG